MSDIIYNNQDEPITISKATSDKLLKENNPSDLMALYWFFYYTAKWQTEKFGVRYTKATNAYAAKGLKMGLVRVKRTARILIKLGLIERVVLRDEGSKRMINHLIKVNFMWGKSQGVETSPLDEKASGIETYRMEIDTTNTKETNSSNTADTMSPGKKRQASEWYCLAIFLSNIITAEKNVNITPQKTKAWAMEMQKLSTRDGIDFPRARKVMKWYSHHVGEQYVPVAESGDTFRKKFLRLEDAMRRDNTMPQPKDIAAAENNIPLDLFGEKLLAFLREALGHENVSKRFVHEHVAMLRDYYNALPDDPEHPGEYNYGPKKSLERDTDFFDRWLTFLQEKQHRNYRLRSLGDLKLGGPRWHEFVKRCEGWNRYSHATGRYIHGGY